jgi:hypothetical protein
MLINNDILFLPSVVYGEKGEEDIANGCVANSTDAKTGSIMP